MSAQHPHSIRKAYADTRAGQMHAMMAGPQDGLAVCLMHWAPMSGTFYTDELPVFAELGYRAVALDLIGFGRSDKRGDHEWSTEMDGATVADALLDLGVKRVVMQGGHFSSAAAIEAAHDPRLETVAIVLDNGPLMPPEAVEAIKGKALSVGEPGLQPDGSHESYLWRLATNTLSIFDDSFPVDQAHLPRLYRFIQDFLAADPFDPKPTMFNDYDFAGRLAALDMPGLAVTSENEPLRASHEPILAAMKRAHAHVFPGGHPLHHVERAGEFARAIDEFVRVHKLID